MAKLFGKFNGVISINVNDAKNIDLQEKEFEFSDMVLYKIIAYDSDGNEKIIECHDHDIKWSEIVE